MKRSRFLTCLLALLSGFPAHMFAADACFPDNISTETTPKGQITRLVGSVTYTEDEKIERKTASNYSDGAFCVGTHLGDGELIVADGVELNFSNSLYAGGKGYGSSESGAANGTITVGKGAVVTVGVNTYSSGGHHVDVGNSSADITGTLNINGGTVNTTQAVVGYNKALGVVNITNGGVLNLSLDHVNDTTQIDFLAGYLGKAEFNLNDGHIKDSRAGQTFIACYNGTAEINLEHGSTWESDAVVFAGYGSTKDCGTITVSGDSFLSADAFQLYAHLEVVNEGTLQFDSYSYLEGGHITCSNGGVLRTDFMQIESGTDNTTGKLTLQNGATLDLATNMILDGTLELDHASHTIREDQLIQTKTAAGVVTVKDGATLVNYGEMYTTGEGAALEVQLEAGSRFQTGTMQVTGRGAEGDDNIPLNILGYGNGLTGAVSITLPAEGKLSLGSVLEGRNADNTGYELQKVYLGDYERINDTLLKGLGLANAAASGNIQFDYETRHIMLVLSTDEVNKHDGTHTVSVGEGSGVVIENGGRTEGETKAGTIGSYSTDGSNTTQADVRVSEAASNTAGMQSVVEWHGSSLETISGESTTLTAGVTVTMTDKTEEGFVKDGTLMVKEGSSLTNDGIIHGHTVVEENALFKGSGTMGKTDVYGDLVVGNSPGLQTYNGNLTLYSSSSTTFSVAGLDNAATIGNTGWDSHTYSQITLGAGCTATLQAQASIIIEFGGTEIHALGGYHQELPFSFDLLLISGNLLLPEGMTGLADASGEIDITGHINATFTVTQDVAARYGNADNMQVNILPGEYQFLVTKTADSTYKDLRLVGRGTVSVPEPATGTLSLLALAALCARRRRKA